jgi:hypothetical protein
MPTLMHRTFLAAGLLAALAVAGCEQPAAFVPRDGNSTGYTDARLGANRYRVTFTGNAATSRETVENYLMLRAAQVTLQAGYKWFVFDTRDTRAKTSYHTEFDGPPWGPGFHHRFGWYGWGPDYVDSYPTTDYEAYAEIVLLTPEQAKNEPRAIDANDVVAHLTPPPPPPAH